MFCVYFFDAQAMKINIHEKFYIFSSAVLYVYISQSYLPPLLPSHPHLVVTYLLLLLQSSNEDNMEENIHSTGVIIIINTMIML